MATPAKFGGSQFGALRYAEAGAPAQRPVPAGAGRIAYVAPRPRWYRFRAWVLAECGGTAQGLRFVPGPPAPAARYQPATGIAARAVWIGHSVRVVRRPAPRVMVTCSGETLVRRSVDPMWAVILAEDEAVLWTDGPLA